MIGRDAMRRCFISLLLLLIGTSLAFAQPFTRRSSQVQHDGLKKYYEIANFRLGGKYDLSDPSKWENGGEGGMTLESLGAGKLRTAYIAIGTPGATRQAKSPTPWSSTPIIPAIRPICTSSGSRVPRCQAASRHRPGPADRYRPLLRRHGRSARHLGRQQAIRRARHQVSAVQLLRHGAGQLSHAARPAEGRARCAGHRRLDGRHADLCLGRDASGIHRRADADRRHDAVGRRRPGRQLDLPVDDGRDRVRSGLAGHQGRLLQAAQGKAPRAGRCVRLVGARHDRL